MKTILITMVLTLSCTVMADVHEESLHKVEMEAIDQLFRAMGKNVTVYCFSAVDEEGDDCLVVGALYNGNYFDWDDTSDRECIGGAIFALAEGTRELNWNPLAICVLFEDGYGCVVTTADARVLVDNYEDWTPEEVQDWYDNHVCFD